MHSYPVERCKGCDRVRPAEEMQVVFGVGARCERCREPPKRECTCWSIYHGQHGIPCLFHD